MFPPHSTSSNPTSSGNLADPGEPPSSLSEDGPISQECPIPAPNLEHEHGENHSLPSQVHTPPDPPEEIIPMIHHGNLSQRSSRQNHRRGTHATLVRGNPPPLRQPSQPSTNDEQSFTSNNVDQQHSPAFATAPATAFGTYAPHSRTTSTTEGFYTARQSRASTAWSTNQYSTGTLPIISPRRHRQQATNRQQQTTNPTFHHQHQTSNSSSLTSNTPDVCYVLQELTESTLKLQETIAIQQEMFQQFLISQAEAQRQESEARAHQNQVMLQQLEAIRDLSRPRAPSPISRVPQSHFQSSPQDGISIADTTSIRTTKVKDENQIPTSTQDDAASVTSVQTIQSTTQAYNHHDAKLNIETFNEEWMSRKQSAEAKLWMGTMISELASKPYYHPLLTADKKSINFNADIEGPNATLYSALQKKLSSSFATMMWNSQLTTGTSILQFIHDSTKVLRGHKSNANSSISRFFSLKWNYSKDNIHAFNKIFNELLNIVLENNPSFPPDQMKSVWINALPGHFSNLKRKFKEDKLDENWSNANTSARLFVLTQIEMQNCSISLKTAPPNPNPPGKNANADKEKDKGKEKRVVSLQAIQAVPASERNPFPADYPFVKKLTEHVKSLVAAGETKEKVESKFKAGYEFQFCWLCRIKPPNKNMHYPNQCPILKTLFSTYSTPNISTRSSTKLPIGTSK